MRVLSFIPRLVLWVLLMAAMYFGSAVNWLRYHRDAIFNVLLHVLILVLCGLALLLEISDLVGPTK